MPFMAKGNVMIAEWSACAPMAHTVVRSCQCLKNTALDYTLLSK
jgi:hypothetical protein